MYGITEDGRVWSYYVGKYISPAISKIGYYYVNIKNKDKERKHMFIHRLVALAYIPNPDNKPDVNHKDGDKSHNEVSNLEWMTKSENSQDAWDTGLFYKDKNFYKITCEQDNTMLEFSCCVDNKSYTNQQVIDILQNDLEAENIVIHSCEECEVGEYFGGFLITL
jgi:hypothetical protein